MSDVKLTHRWWQRLIFSNHDEDGRTLPSDTTGIPAPRAPYNPPEHDGMQFSFLFWSASGTASRQFPATPSGGWVTTEDDHLLQPGLTPPPIDPWWVSFPDSRDHGTVTAWYALIEDYPALGVHVDAFSLESGTFLDWQADPSHPVFTSDHGWWGAEGMVQTTRAAEIAAPDTWPPPNPLIPGPGPELEFHSWLILRSSPGVTPTKTSLRVAQNASALAFALYAAPEHVKPPLADYPWPIHITRQGDPRPSELTKEIARLAYIHDLAGELSAPAKSAIQGDALGYIAEVAKLHQGATEPTRPKQTKKSTSKR